MQRFFIILTLLFLFCFFSTVQAQDNQDLTDITEDSTVDDISGTDDSLDTSTDTQPTTPTDNSSTPVLNTVPGSPEEFLQLQADNPPSTEENTQSQGDQATTDEPTEESETENAGFLLKFDYESRVVVTNTTTGIDFLEIDYLVKMEQEIEIADQRKHTTGQANVMTDIIGYLGSNDLFVCELEIDMNNADVSITTRQITTMNQFDEPVDAQLSIQLGFNKTDLMEDWFSKCSAVDGSKLNTQGEQEKYLYQTLLAIQPSLEGLLFEDFDPDETSSLTLTTEEIVLDDYYGDEQFSLTGMGTVSVEPIKPQ